jgi:hypothetical protein
MPPKQRNDQRNSFVGNGSLPSVINARLNTTDLPLIYINSDLGQLSGEDPRKRIDKQTVTVTTAGQVTLTRYMQDEVGDALASGVVVEIEGTEYTTATGGKIAHVLAIATFANVQLMLDGINALPGFIAVIGDALTTTPLATGKHIALTEINIPFIGMEPLGICDNDVSATNIAYKRIGLPTRKDRDPLQLLQIRGKITSATGGLIQVIGDEQDDYVLGGAHQEVYEEYTPSTSLTAHLTDTILDAQTLRGAITLVVSATAITGADYSLKYKQALGM